MKTALHVHVLCWLFIAATALACSEEPHNTYALWQRHEHPDDRFHLYLLSPPWKAAAESTPPHPQFLLEPLPYKPAKGPAATMRAEAWWAPSTKSTAQLSARLTHWQSKGYTLVGKGEHHNAFYQKGLALQMAAPPLWVREVYFDTAKGTATLSIWGRSAAYTDDVDAMLDGFGPPKAGAR